MSETIIWSVFMAPGIASLQMDPQNKINSIQQEKKCHAARTGNDEKQVSSCHPIT